MRARILIGGAALAALAVAGLRLAPRTATPRLLWWEGRAVSWSEERGVVLSQAGDLLEAAGAGVLRLPLRAGERALLSAAAGTGDRVWVVDDGGLVLRWNDDGSLSDAGRTPFDVPVLSGGPNGSLWAARSPMQLTLGPESAGAPALVRLDSALRPELGAGRADIQRSPLMTQLANAGHVLAMPDGGAVFAPSARDEVVRYGPDGAERWRLVRGLAQAPPDPPAKEESPTHGPRLQVDHAPVNLGLAAGPDGLLYVLSADPPTERGNAAPGGPGSITAGSRLYAVDPETGRVLRTRRFETALPTLAVDAGGGVTTPEPGRLLPGSDPDRRASFEPFDVPGLRGGRITLAAMRGKVTLVNFWASWCGPCAEELPALDSLAGTADTARVSFLALSDDVSDDAARQFVAARSFRNLRFALGSGSFKRRYQYFGLPYTVLLDGRGRIVHRWSGYGGPAQLEEIARLVRAELGRSPSDLHDR